MNKRKFYFFCSRKKVVIIMTECNEIHIFKFSIPLMWNIQSSFFLVKFNVCNLSSLLCMWKYFFSHRILNIWCEYVSSFHFEKFSFWNSLFLSKFSCFYTHSRFNKNSIISSSYKIVEFFHHKEYTSKTLEKNLWWVRIKMMTNDLRNKKKCKTEFSKIILYVEENLHHLFLSVISEKMRWKIYRENLENFSLSLII